MIRYSEETYDNIFLSYEKILERLHANNITNKNGSKITKLDLRKAIIIMLEKHPTCRWRSEKIRSKKYYVLVEGLAWLVQVYFQKGKTMIDADIDFFKKRIGQYEDLLKIPYSKHFWDKAMTIKQLEEYFTRDISTVRKAITKMCNEGLAYCKHYIAGKVVIDPIGIKWLCQNVFKQKYLELLEKYKMELTEKYIEAGYPYDHFFNSN